MASIEISGLLVQPIAQRVSAWLASGKLDEDDLGAVLSSDARAWVDHAMAAADWAAITDVEGLVTLCASQLGGETGLVEWADEMVSGWLAESSVEDLLVAARGLVDGPGFVASHASERLIRSCPWRYEGSGDAFCVCLTGVGAASPALKALLGACLARLAAVADVRKLDVRFDGVDGDELMVFGEVDALENSLAESRLHRAALVP